jgi:hypothetical protein
MCEMIIREEHGHDEQSTVHAKSRPDVRLRVHYWDHHDHLDRDGAAMSGVQRRANSLGCFLTLVVLVLFVWVIVFPLVDAIIHPI